MRWHNISGLNNGPVESGRAMLIFSKSTPTVYFRFLAAATRVKQNSFFIFTSWMQLISLEKLTPLKIIQMPLSHSSIVNSSIFTIFHLLLFYNTTRGHTILGLVTFIIVIRWQLLKGYIFSQANQLKYTAIHALSHLIIIS